MQSFQRIPSSQHRCCVELASSFRRSKTRDHIPKDARFAAGAALIVRSLDREVGVFEWTAANAHLMAVRSYSLMLPYLASQMCLRLQ